MKRFLCLILAVVLCIGCLSGCSPSFSLDVRLGEYPVTLDPQVASTQTQLIIAQNAFEGLLKFDETGTPVAAAAEKYSISNDGLTYTFTLRKGLKWSNGEDVTPDDFVFALERITDASTNAKYGYLFSNIKGASKRLNGGNVPLGVSASGERTVVIRLERADSSLLSALCHPAASPCKRDYFNKCNGKYGIGVKNIISNGIFKISYIKEKSLIRLIKNTNYKGEFLSSCTGVDIDFEPIGEDENYDQLLADGKWDIAIADRNSAKKAADEGRQIIHDYDSAYFLLINPKASVCKNSNIRRSLMLCLGEIDVKDFYAQKQFLPEVLTINGVPASAVSGLADFTFTTDTALAKQLFIDNASSSLINSSSGITVLCEDNSETADVLRGIVSVWQAELGVYFNIEKQSESILNYRIKNGNYTIALAKISSPDRTAKGFMSELCTALGEPTELKDLVDAASTVFDSGLTVGYVNSFALSLGSNSYAIPIMKAETVYCCDTECENVFITPNNTLDFSYIKN